MREARTESRRGRGRRVALSVMASACVVMAGAVPVAAQSGQEFYEYGLWWWDAMRVGQAHEVATGEGVTIALLDGQLFAEAPELAGQDVVLGESLCQDPMAGDPLALTGPPSDLTDHTTAMAALLVGNGTGNAPDGWGASGIAPDATVRVYLTYDEWIDDDPERGVRCRYGDEDHGEFIAQVVADGADIVVAPTTMLYRADDAVTEAIRDHGVIFIGGLGNDGQGQRPRGIGNLIGAVNVAAADGEGRFAEFNSTGWDPVTYLTAEGARTTDAAEGVVISPYMSNAGRPVITTPGVDIAVGGAFEGEWRSNSIVGGTSAASVLAAGALAVVMSHWPEASGNQVLQSMVRNANPIGAAELEVGYDNLFGYGYLSLTSMLQEDPTQYPDQHPYYGGLRWALHEDPPEPDYGEPGSRGDLSWRPTFTEDELELPWPRGPGQTAEPTTEVSSDVEESATIEPPATDPGLPSDTDDDVIDESGAGPAWLVTVVVGVVLVVAAIGTVWWRRRTSTPKI